MTSPLHGENRRFEFDRAHHFFLDSEAEIVSDGEREQDKKLHNSRGEDTKVPDEKFEEPGWDEDFTKPITIYPSRTLLWSPQMVMERKKFELEKRRVESIEKLVEMYKGSDTHSDADSNKQPVSHFSKSELNEFVTHRKKGRADKTKYWIHKASEALWDCTGGEISHTSMKRLNDYALHKYTSADSHSKLLSSAKGFLKHLARQNVDQRYLSYTLFLDLPKRVKERHAITSQIVTKEDIENVLAYIHNAEREGRISNHRAQQYTGFVIFGAFTGQRSLATMAKLTVGQ